MADISGGALVFKTKLDTNGLKKGEKETKGILGNMVKSVNSMDIFAGLGLSAVAAFGKIISVNKEFEKSQSSLQSILGLTKDEMGFFKEASIEMGATSTKTAVQVSEAFKLIGSQKPELLKDRDALKAVTEQAIILSEAAEIDIPIAAKAMTGALNQMGEGADQAARYVNVLAAGSKEGAADIPYLNAAIEKSGAVAADANLSFEQLTAGVEILGTKISEPTTAGLQFKDMLLRLQVAGYGMESGMFNLKDALTDVNIELEAIEDPTKKIAKETEIFGKISLVAGKTLRNNIGEYERLTQAVTGTGTAIEQQATNIDNLDGDLNKFTSTLEGVILNINSDNGLTGAIRVLVGWGIKLLENIGLIAKVFAYTATVIISYQLATKLATLWTNRQTAASLSAIVVEKAKTLAFNVQLGAIALYNAATSLLTGKTKAATTQMKIFNATTKANPIGLLVAVLTTAYFAFQEFNGEIEEGNKYLVDFNKELIKEQTELDNVFDALKKTNPETEARAELINNINSKYGQYLGNISDEAEFIAAVEVAQIAATEALQSNLALKIQEKEIEKSLTGNITKRAELNAEILSVATKNNKKLTRQVGEEFKTLIELSSNLSNLQGADFDKGYKEIIRLKTKFKKDYIKGNTSFYEDEGIILEGWINKAKKLEREAVDEKIRIQETFSSFIITNSEDDGKKEVEINHKKSLEKIKSLKNGYAKEKALINYEYETKIQTASANNESTIKLEQELQSRLSKVAKKYTKPKAKTDSEKKANDAKIMSDARALEDFKLSILQEGTEKEIKQVELKYERLKEQAEIYELSTIELLKKRDAEIKKITDDAEQIEKDKEKANEEKEKEKAEKEYTFLQEKMLNEFLLFETDAQKIEDFENNQNIAKLQRKLNTETELTEIQRSAIQSRIDLLSKEDEQTSELQDLAVSSAEQFADGIASIEKDSNKTAAENAEERRKVLLNSARNSIKIALVKSLASVLGDAFEKFGVYGLIAAPIAAAAAGALFNTVIPKFATGGVIPEGYQNDSYHAMLQSNEVVLNPKQNANLLFKLANNGGSTGNKFDMNRVLNAQNQTNELLKNQKSAVIYGNNLKTVDRHGNLTGDMISLSN